MLISLSLLLLLRLTLSRSVEAHLNAIAHFIIMFAPQGTSKTRYLGVHLRNFIFSVLHVRDFQKIPTKDLYGASDVTL